MRVGVIGAGPAGLLFSSLIKSHSVDVFEEHRRVGWPPHCAGLVSPATAIRLSSYAGRDVVGTSYHSLIIRSGLRPVLEASGSPLAVRIKRPLLEERLAEKTVNNGHRLLLGLRVRSIEPSIGAIRTNNAWEKYDLVVVAAGPKPSLIRGMPCIREYRLLNGLQAVVEAQRRTDPGVFEVVYSPLVSRRMFGWIIPLGDRRILVGTADEGTPYPGLQALLHMLGREGRLRRVEYYYGGKISRGPPCPKPAVGKTLMLGDSAGMVKPYTGGGLYGISVSAPIAASMVDEELEDIGEATAWLRRKLSAQYRLMRVASRLGPKASAKLLGIIGSSRHGLLALSRIDYDSHEGLLTSIAPRIPLIIAEALIHKA